MSKYKSIKKAARIDKKRTLDKIQAAINANLHDLNNLGQERLDLGNSFLEGVEVTEEMVIQLNEGKYHDELFQNNWNRFQEIQKMMMDLKNKGADLVIQKNRLTVTSSKAIKFRVVNMHNLVKLHQKQQNDEVGRITAGDRGM